MEFVNHCHGNNRGRTKSREGTPDFESFSPNEDCLTSSEAYALELEQAMSTSLHLFIAIGN